MSSSASELLVDIPTSRLDVFLANKTGKSRTFIKLQIEAGRVRVNETPILKPSTSVHSGDTILFEFVEDTRLELTPISGDLDILFEDPHLLVLNKAQGVVVHPALGHRGETLVHHLLYHLRHSSAFSELPGTRPGIVHRLDRGTSGVLVVGKTREIQEALATQFKARQVRKVYEAAVWGKTRAKGTIQSIIGRDRKDRHKMSSRTSQGREATTYWERAEAFNSFSHLLLYPRTGRTHQLRVHLSEMGHPVVGDDLYGRGLTRKRRAFLSDNLAHFLENVSMTFLHAKALTFTHPVTGKEMTLEANRPKLFEEFLCLLKKENESES